MIDSGAQANTITLSHWRRICANPESRISDVSIDPPATLHNYAGGPIETKATFVANIEMENGLRKMERETFHVVAKARRGLLSFLTAKRMGLIRIGRDICVVEEDQKEFPKIPNMQIKLEIDDTILPVRNVNYRIPWALQATTQRQLDDLEKQGIIERAPANTPWMSKLSSVEKGSVNPKSGAEPDRRLVVNMRAVNEAIRRVNHPMPYLENFLPMLHGSKYYTKLDLKSAYYHIELHPRSRDLTTFMTAKGPMRFTRIPFGINAAPEIFQKTMESILVDENGSALCGTVAYSDDILIFGQDEAELESRTGRVMGILKANNLTINYDKSEFNKTEVTFLGHHISAEGVRPAVDKLQAIANFRTPANKSELRSFLGLVTYIGASVKNLSDKTTLLRGMLLKTVHFTWSVEQKKAFNDLKEYIKNEVKERGFFQADAETHLYTDASPTALGAVLVQLQMSDTTRQMEKRVIMCVSKSLTETEKRYPQTHKEALAIVWAVEKLHFYLLGRSFIIYTDHEPLEFIFKQKNASDKRAMTRAEGWALRLSSYNYTLRHVSSGENIADPLSRICDQKDDAYIENYENYGLFSIETNFEALCYDWNRMRITEEAIKDQTADDDECKEIERAIEHNSWTNWDMKGYRQVADELSKINGIVRRGTLIVPPKSIRQLIVKIAHAGHAGLSSMKRHIRAHFWWPRMDDEIDKERQTCETCTFMQRDSAPAPMKRTPMPKKPWEYLALDYYSMEDPVNLKILVMQDYHSKYVKVTFVQSTNTKGAIDFLSKAFEDDGLPSRIISDNGPPFQGEAFIKWCNERKIKVKKSTPALPRANGMVERFMQSLTRVLKALKIEANLTETSARKAVKLLVFMYNRRPHSITEETPFKLLKGRESDDIFPTNDAEPTPDLVELESKVTQKQIEGKLYMDSYTNAKFVDIKIGDEVAIKNISKSKLDPNFKPIWYKVVEKDGTELTLEHEGKQTKRNANHVAKRPMPANNENRLPFSSTQNPIATTSPRNKRRSKEEEMTEDTTSPRRSKRARIPTTRYNSTEFMRLVEHAMNN